MFKISLFRKRILIKCEYIIIYFILFCQFFSLYHQFTNLALIKNIFSRFKKNLENFCPYSCQSHLLLILTPFAFILYISSSPSFYLKQSSFSKHFKFFSYNFDLLSRIRYSSLSSFAKYLESFAEKFLTLSLRNFQET